MVGSDVTIDVHTTEDVDIDSIRSAVRSGDQVDPALAESVRRAVDRTVRQIMEENDLSGFDLDVDVDLVDGRVPGAPRERVATRLDVDGEDELLAAVGDTLSPPQRARIADAVEGEALEFLDRHDLKEPTQIIVRVTPVQFR